MTKEGRKKQKKENKEKRAGQNASRVCPPSSSPIFHQLLLYACTFIPPRSIFFGRVKCHSKSHPLCAQQRKYIIKSRVRAERNLNIQKRATKRRSTNDRRRHQSRLPQQQQLTDLAHHSCRISGKMSLNLNATQIDHAMLRASQPDNLLKYFASVAVFK